MQNNSSYLSKYIPNSITILSLCCGLTSIKFSLSQDWKISIYLIIFAAIFDFFDGWFARKLKGGSNFGAELDSLSDFISFGVAPSIYKIATSYNLSFLPTSIIPDSTIIPEKRVIKAIEFIIIIKRFKIDFIAL